MEKKAYGPAWTITKPAAPPHRILFFDTETLPVGSAIAGLEIHRLRLGHAICREFVDGQYLDVFRRDFFSADEFGQCVEHAQEHHRKLWVVCHNANFDWRIVDLVGLCQRRGWLFYSPSRENVILQEKRKGNIGLPLHHFSHKYGACFITLWINGRRVDFLDSLNWYPFSAAALGEMLGVGKLPQPSRHASDAEWLVYCRRDVEIIADACCRWIEGTEQRGWGAPKVTLASTSAQVFRSQFLRNPIYCPDLDADREFHRAAYYGGRVDVRRLGVIPERIQCWDVSSLYPSVMRGQLYPTKLLRRVYDAPTSSLRQYLNSHCVIGEVDIDSETIELPVRIDGRVRYCTGKFKTHLAGPELEWALSNDCISKVHRLDLFEPAELFTDYVETLYSLRQHASDDNNHVMKTVYKLLLNSLYGKFGQKGVDYHYYVDEDPHPPAMEVGQCDDKGLFRIDKERFGPVVRVSREEGESRLSHPAIAAYVTSYGRMYLLAAKQALGESGWCYSDTDSLFTLAEGQPPIKWQAGYPVSGLGSWRLVTETRGMVIHGKKDYEYVCPECCGQRLGKSIVCARCHNSGMVRTIKGVRNSAQIISTAMGVDGFNALGNKSERPQIRRSITVRQLLFHSLAEVWHSGWTPEVRIENITKVLSRVFRDGHIMPDGTIRPFHLLEGQYEDCLANPRRWHEAVGLTCAPVQRRSSDLRRKQIVG